MSKEQIPSKEEITFEKCQQEVARQNGCSDWDSLLLNLYMPDIMKSRGGVYNEAAELYATLKTKSYGKIMIG